MRPLTFRDLDKLTAFEFDHSDMTSCSDLMHGPWLKISARRYHRIGNPAQVYTIGTTKARVNPDDTCRPEKES